MAGTITLYYTAFLLPDGEGYRATAPAVPTCDAAGQTADAAVASLRDALRAAVESLAQRGQDVPIESAKAVEEALSRYQTSDSTALRIKTETVAVEADLPAW